MKKFILLVTILALTLGLFAAEVVIGTGTSYNGDREHPSPYGNWFKNNRDQYLVTVDELNYAGGEAGNINSLAFNVQALNGVAARFMSIKMGHTTQTRLSNTFVTGLTEVYSTYLYTPALGWNTHLLYTPFDWNGEDNLVVEVYYGDLGQGFTRNASVYYSTATNMALYYRSDSGNANNASTGTLSSNRPNIKFNMGDFVAPFTQVLAPNGSEHWQAGTVQTVYWHCNVYHQVNVLLSLNNGQSWIMMNTSPVETRLGRFSFTVPFVSSTQCLIKVESTDRKSVV